MQKNMVELILQLPGSWKGQGALMNVFIAVILSQMPKGNCYFKSSKACENR